MDTDTKIHPLLKMDVSRKAFLFVGPISNHQFLITEKGDVYGWGDNAFSQVVNSKMKIIQAPQHISSLYIRNIVSAACGLTHSLGLSENGQVFGWGSNTSGKLGVRGGSFKYDPELVYDFNSEKIISVACGSDHSIALSGTGQVYEWGFTVGPTPKIIKHLNDKMIILISCGYKHAVALSASRQVYIWYYIEATSTTRIPDCVEYLNDKSIITVACGGLHTVAMSNQGQLYSWGINDDGQLGIGNTLSQSLPQFVPYLFGVRFLSVACGSAHTIALSDKGEIWGFGSNMHRQLGNIDSGSALLPVFIHKPTETKIISVACGRDHSLALLESGDVLSWGSKYGEFCSSTKKTKHIFQNGNINNRITSILSCARILNTKYQVFHQVAKRSRFILRDLEELSDMEIRTKDGQIFKVHKPILSVRSPELLKRIGEIFRYPNAMKHLIEYLYTEELSGDLTIQELFEILDHARDLKILRLQLLCENEIYQKICLDNISTIMGFEKNICSKLIRDRSLWFISNHYADFSSEQKEILSNFLDVKNIEDLQRSSVSLLCPGPNLIPPCTLVDDLGRLWKSKLFWDFVIKIDGKKIRSHKCVLAATSSFFRGMMSGQFKETKNNRCTLRELQVPTKIFKHLLRYLYTAQFNFSREDCLSLLNCVQFLGIDVQDFIIKATTDCLF